MLRKLQEHDGLYGLVGDAIILFIQPEQTISFSWGVTVEGAFPKICSVEESVHLCEIDERINLCSRE